jgi:hypothetical protein
VIRGISRVGVVWSAVDSSLTSLSFSITSTSVNDVFSGNP